MSSCARENNELATEDTYIPSTSVVEKSDYELEIKPEEGVVNESVAEESLTESDEQKETSSVEARPPILTDRSTFTSVDALCSALTLKDHIIFKGSKLRTEEAVVQGSYTYFPAVIEVIEPYYGTIEKGATVVLWEQMGTVQTSSDTVETFVQTDMEPLNADEEHIFILKAAGDHYGYTFRAHSYTKVADRASLASKVEKGTATKLEQFRSSVLETYLNNPDTRLDLHAEASKLVSGIPENATEAEILNALPAEQKALFEDLIQQYGTK